MVSAPGLRARPHSCVRRLRDPDPYPPPRRRWSGRCGRTSGTRHNAETLVARGRGPFYEEGNEQYTALCEQLVARRGVRRPHFSWGDGVIDDCAARFTSSPGGQRRLARRWDFAPPAGGQRTACVAAADRKAPGGDPRPAGIAAQECAGERPSATDRQLAASSSAARARPVMRPRRGRTAELHQGDDSLVLPEEADEYLRIDRRIGLRSPESSVKPTSPFTWTVVIPTKPAASPRPRRMLLRDNDGAPVEEASVCRRSGEAGGEACRAPS